MGLAMMTKIEGLLELLDLQSSCFIDGEPAQTTLLLMKSATHNSLVFDLCGDSDIGLNQKDKEGRSVVIL